MIRYLILILLWCCVGYMPLAAQDAAYDLVVAQDGSGNYTGIQEAIHSLRAFQPRKRILIKSGVYKEKVVVPAWLENVVLVGEDAAHTVITWDDHANIRNMGTFRTYTLLVQGNGFEAYNITIENNAPQLGQAVALHTEADRVVLVQCRLLGNQDTYYAGKPGSRQYLEQCYIEGTTDFIFGGATVWMEQCQVHSKRNSYITAASTPQDVPYGFVFNGCRFTADQGVDSVYLGRPWRPYAMTLVMHSQLGEHICSQGWDNWRNPDNERTARYMEYANNGAGANNAKRVGWSRQLTPEQAGEFTVQKVMGGCDGWSPLAPDTVPSQK